MTLLSEPQINNKQAIYQQLCVRSVPMVNTRDLHGENDISGVMYGYERTVKMVSSLLTMSLKSLIFYEYSILAVF